jgi:hydrogenase nickel incorporation protein HypA/HybF
MHEKYVIDNLMKKVLEIAEKERAKKVVRVSVTLGALSHMSHDHFKEHFDIAAKGTIAQDAEIDSEESKDEKDPNAMTVVLKSIDVAE